MFNIRLTIGSCHCLVVTRITRAVDRFVHVKHQTIDKTNKYRISANPQTCVEAVSHESVTPPGPRRQLRVKRAMRLVGPQPSAAFTARLLNIRRLLAGRQASSYGTHTSACGWAILLVLTQVDVLKITSFNSITNWSQHPSRNPTPICQMPRLRRHHHGLAAPSALPHSDDHGPSPEGRPCRLRGRARPINLTRPDDEADVPLSGSPT